MQLRSERVDWIFFPDQSCASVMTCESLDVIEFVGWMAWTFLDYQHNTYSVVSLSIIFEAFYYPYPSCGFVPEYIKKIIWDWLLHSTMWCQKYNILLYFFLRQSIRLSRLSLKLHSLVYWFHSSWYHNFWVVYLWQVQMNALKCKPSAQLYPCCEYAM